MDITAITLWFLVQHFVVELHLQVATPTPEAQSWASKPQSASADLSVMYKDVGFQYKDAGFQSMYSVYIYIYITITIDCQYHDYSCYY